jgi:hypothetical protein
VLGYCAEFVCRSCFFLLIKVSPVNEQKVVIPPQKFAIMLDFLLDIVFLVWILV